MRKTWIGILLACFMLNAAFAGATEKGSISSVSAGPYDPADRRLLALAFMNSVYAWLHRYQPELISRDAEHVKMRVNYDFSFDIDLTIKADTYEIKVTLAQRLITRTEAPTIQKDADKLAPGVRGMMEGELERSRPSH